MSGIRRDLPNDEFLAAINANAANAGNPFATVADLPAPSGDGIYDGSGSVPNGTVATLQGTLQFAVDAGRKFLVAPSTITTNVGDIDFRSRSSLGTYIGGFTSATDGDFALRVGNNSGTIVGLVVEDNGDVRLCENNNVSASRGRLTIGVPSVVSNSLLTVRPTTSGVGDITMLVQNGSGATSFQIQNDGRVGIGSIGSTTTKLNVRGAGNTDSTTLVNFESANGFDKFQMRDDGQFGYYAGASSASVLVNTAWYHQSRDYSTSMRIQGRTSTQTTLAVFNGSTNANPYVIDARFNGNITGTATTIRALSWEDSSSTNIGVNGSARNGSSFNIGLDGACGGGASQAPSQYNAAVRGVSSPNLDATTYGGYFSASANAPIVFNSDFIAVFGTVGSNTLDEASNADFIAAQFRVTDNNGSGNNMAINVPSTGNIGNIVLGADAPSVNNSFVEVTGDIEIIGNTNGVILEAQNGGRWKVEVLNDGTLDTNLA